MAKVFTDYRGTIAKEEWNDAWELLNSRVVSKTTDYTATTDDGVILCSGNFVVTLPTAVGIGGKIFYIKNIGDGTITASGNASETIDGDITQLLDEQYDEIPVLSDGVNWSIL